MQSKQTAVVSGGAVVSVVGEVTVKAPGQGKGKGKSGAQAAVRRFRILSPPGFVTSANFEACSADDDADPAAIDISASPATSPATSPSKEGGQEEAGAGEDEAAVRARREAAALQLDTEARTALFHACASDHFACTELLLLLAPAAVTQADKFGDTSLHSAAATRAGSANSGEDDDYSGGDGRGGRGSARCLELCVRTLYHLDADATTAPLNCRNKQGMLPGHLAATGAAVECLASNGAILTAADHHGRSPLFIACAMGELNIGRCLHTESLHVKQF